jgi:hypothetical protein
LKQILRYMKEWQVHLRVARLSAVEGPHSKESQILVDDFLAGRDISGDGDKGDVGNTAAERRELFWASYQGKAPNSGDADATRGMAAARAIGRSGYTSYRDAPAGRHRRSSTFSPRRFK